MIQNNLDPANAEKPEDLIVYGGFGKAARNWESFDAILSCLRTMDVDETLLVQSGKPVGVVKTHTGAPRVIIANSNLVPKWATWDEFRRLDAQHLRSDRVRLGVPWSLRTKSRKPCGKCAARYPVYGRSATIVPWMDEVRAWCVRLGIDLCAAYTLGWFVATTRCISIDDHQTTREHMDAIRTDV